MRSVDFSGDGQSLLTASDDKTVKVMYVTNHLGKYRKTEEKRKIHFDHTDSIYIYIPQTLTGVDSSSSEVSVFSECSHELGEMCKVQRNISLPLLSILQVLSSWRERSGTNNLLDQQHWKLLLVWCSRDEGDVHRKLIRCWISSVFNA